MPSKFYKINPLNGAIRDTVDMPFDGKCSGIAYDGASLWVVKFSYSHVIYQIGLDGGYIGEFPADFHGTFHARYIDVEGEFLWVAAYGWGYQHRLYKLTRSGEIVEWYDTTDILTYENGLVLNTQYPSGSNLFMTDTYDNSIKRLSIEDGEVTVADQCQSPAYTGWPWSRLGGLAFDGEHLWHYEFDATYGVIWCLDDGLDLLGDYKIVQALGEDTFGASSTGQTFTPGVGIDPDPGPVSTVDLLQISFYKGNYGASDPSATTWLNLYDGNPHDGGVLVGSSTNSIDTSVEIAPSAPLTWQFDELTLDNTTEYWSIMESTDTGGALDVGVSLETHDRNLHDVYTGGTGLIADQARHPDSVDAKFRIWFESSFPIPDIKANGEDGPVTIYQGTPLPIEISLNPKREEGSEADWWLLADSPLGWYYYDRETFGWIPGSRVGYQAPLSVIDPITVCSGTTLPHGSYTFQFGVDTEMNGIFDPDAAYIDSVQVTVLENSGKQSCAKERPVIQ